MKTFFEEMFSALGFKKLSFDSDFWNNDDRKLVIINGSKDDRILLVLRDASMCSIKIIKGRSAKKAIIELVAAMTEYEERVRERRPKESILKLGDSVKCGLGRARYARIQRLDNAPMGWEELQEKFSESMPGKWAVQVFPPDSHVVNAEHAYHLWVLQEPPKGLAFQFPE